MAESFAKDSCVDVYNCMVYIVPSDNSITEFSGPFYDLFQRRMIWVDEMTEAVVG